MWWEKMTSVFFEGLWEEIFERLYLVQKRGYHAINLVLRYYNKCKKKIVILKSIGIIAIKSSETRSVVYTCRYSSGHF